MCCVLGNLLVIHDISSSFFIGNESTAHSGPSASTSATATGTGGQSRGACTDMG